MLGFLFVAVLGASPLFPSLRSLYAVSSAAARWELTALPIPRLSALSVISLVGFWDAVKGDCSDGAKIRLFSFSGVVVVEDQLVPSSISSMISPSSGSVGFSKVQVFA